MKKSRNFNPEQLSQRSNSVATTSIALDEMGVALHEADIRRLAIFARNTPYWGDVHTKLLQVIELYRADPRMVLAIRGVGVITLLAVDALNRKLSLHKAKKVSGLADNLTLVLEIIRSLEAGADSKIWAGIEAIIPKLEKAKKVALKQELEADIKLAIKKGK